MPDSPLHDPQQPPLPTSTAHGPPHALLLPSQPSGAAHLGKKVCIKEKRAMNLTCVHPLKCTNCGEDHITNDPECLKRTAYQALVSKVIHQTEETHSEADEEPHVI
ncbi:hypothetical protein FRC10_012104 [Ceratobasidium sp. 414]|nr:hypothetical protein FRC10_012104 [Ceratobasidium sp. 414]